MQFLNLDGFDYYLNGREEYDGVWDYGPKTLRKQLDGGTNSRFTGSYWDRYFGREPPAYPGQLGRFKTLSI